jgi:protein SCO1
VVMKRALLFLLLVVSIVGCKKAANEKRYEIEGTVVSVDAGTGEITIAHKAIPGYMDAMTMPYKMKQDWALKAAKPGDRLRGQVVVSDDLTVIDNVTLTQESANAPSTAEGLHYPKVGSEVPDFSFVNQDGRKVKLSSLRGGPVLLTFIYTRCPLPDYCIRMSNNFGEVAKQLQQKPTVWKKSHLLSVSFDPEFDKPNVLRNYGKSYAGEIDPKFEHWEFVTGSAEEIKRAADYFGLVYDPQNGQYIHSLRTALIDNHGKLVEVVHGNEWKPEEMATKMEE